MSITRLQHFPELVIKRTPALARQDLGVLDSTAVLSLMVPLSGQVTNQAVQIANISGMNISQASQIASISGNYSSISYVNTVSGNLSVDIANIDAQIGDIQFSSIQVISASTQPATAPMSADRWFTISVSGSNYVLGLYY